jgi:hypothetical protein
VGDLEAEAELLLGVGGEGEAAAQQFDEAEGVVAVAEDPLEQGHARLVVLDGLQGLGEAGLGVGAVAELERQLGAAVEQLGLADRADRQLDLLLGDLEELAGAAGLGEQAGEQLDRGRVLGEVLEQADEGLDRRVGVALLGVEAGEDRQQEHPARALGAAAELALVELAQALEAAELELHALEAIEGGAEARAGDDGFFVDLAGALELAEVLLEHLAGAQLGLGFLFGGEAGVVGGGDLQLEQLEQLRPGVVGDEVAAGVLERGDVAGEQLEGATHGAEALADAVEADHRQLAEAVEELGLHAGVFGADELELAGAGGHGDVVARGGHAELFEVAPQREVAGLGLGGGVEEADGGAALANFAEGEAGAGERHGPQLGRAGVGLELEGAEHELGVVPCLGEAEEVLQEGEVAGLLLGGGEQELAGEAEVAGVAGLEEGEVAGDGGDGPGVVEDLELGLEVGDQGEDVALGERDGLDGAQDGEVAGGRLEGGLVALQGGAAVTEVGLDQLAALAVEGRGLARVTGGTDLLVEVADRVADVAAAQEDAVEEAHRRPQVRDQLEGVGEEPLGLTVLAARDAPAGAGDGDHGAQLRLAHGRTREHLQHLQQGHFFRRGHPCRAVYTGPGGLETLGKGVQIVVGSCRYKAHIRPARAGWPTSAG